MPTFADFGQISTEQVPQPSGKLPTGFDKFAPTKPATRVSKGKIEQQGEHFKSFQTGTVASPEKKNKQAVQKVLEGSKSFDKNIAQATDIVLSAPTFFASLGATGFFDASAAAAGNPKPFQKANKLIDEAMETPWMKLLSKPIQTLSSMDSRNTAIQEGMEWLGTKIEHGAEKVTKATGDTEKGELFKQVVNIAQGGGFGTLLGLSKGSIDPKIPKLTSKEIAAAWKAKAAERSAPTDVEYTEQVKAGKIVPTEKRLEDLTKLLPRGTGAKQGGAIDFSAFKGSRDDELGKELRGLGFTLPSLEAQPYGKEGITKTQWKQALVNAPQLEKDIAQRVMEKHPDEYIPNKQLVKLLAEDTKDWKLSKVDTTKWAIYGLENIGRDAREVEQSGNARTHLYTLPEHIKLPQSAHFPGASGPYGHTRVFTEDGQTYVTELQADAIQNAKEPLSEQEKAQLEGKLKDQKAEGVRLSKVLEQTYRDNKGTFNHEPIQQVQDVIRRNNLTIAELQNKLTAGQIPDAIKPFVKNWPQKLIQQELQEASSKGEKALRVITANTVAKVEGWPVARLAEYIARLEKDIKYTDQAIETFSSSSKNKIANEKEILYLEQKLFVLKEKLADAKELQAHPENYPKEKLAEKLQKYEDSLNEAVKQTRDGVQDGWEAADGGPNIANTPPDPAKAAQMEAKIPEQMRTATNSMTKAWNAGQYFTSPEYSNIWDRYATDITKYAKSIGGKEVTDKYGHTWLEVPVPKEHLARLVGSHSEQDVMAARARNSIRAAHDKLRGVGAKQGGALDIQAIKDAFDKLKKFAIPRAILHDIGHSVKTMKDLVNPKAHGEQAKVAEAQIRQEIAERMWLDQQLYTEGQVRSDFWDMQGDKASLQFIQDFEKGQPFKDEKLENARQGYKAFAKWLNEVFDKKTGLDYDPVVDYMPHMWEDPAGVEQFFKQRYGKQWGDPNFTKPRSWQFAADALKAGFKLKSNNIEVLMQMRAHASFVARSRANALRMGEYYGYTRRIVKTARGQKSLGTKPFPGGADVELRSPNGDMYYIDPVVYPTFINAFDTKSMWTEPGVGGMIFRAGSKIKNPMVAIDLGWSLFHALHITLGMIPAAELTRMTQLLSSKAISPQAWVKSLYNSMAYTGKGNLPIVGEVREGAAGNRLLKVYKGELKPNSTEAAAIQLMHEGGFVPTLDAKYKGGWQESFKKALMQAKVSKAIAVQPMAFMEWSSSWMTEHMVPSIKINQYLRDVQNWLKSNPDKVNDPAQRMLAFTRISKNIENRFGQMAYDTLLWNRMVKDIGIFSSLSMGWKLGLFRGFVAGTLGEGPSAAYKILEGKRAGVADVISRGELDRTIFTANYVAMTMLYAGIITYLASGQPPQEPMDYVNPCTGRDASGKCTSRVTTMFYTREAVSMTKHIENEGLAAGLSQYIASSAAPQIGEARTFLSGVDGLGREVSNPEDPFYKQMLERIAKIMGDVKPISIQAMGKEGSKLTAGKAAMDVMGFTPAAKYITESKIEGKIAATYRKSNAKAEQPYESVMKGEDKAKLRRLYESGDIEGFNKGIAAMKEKYKLNMEQTAALRKDSRTEGSVKMFTALTWKQQLNLLKQMSDEEKEKYLRHAHKEAKHALARGE